MLVGTKRQREPPWLSPKKRYWLTHNSWPSMPWRLPVELGPSAMTIGGTRRLRALTNWAVANNAERQATQLAIAAALQYAYQGRTDYATTWLRHAESGLKRRPDPRQELALAHARGLWLLKQRRVDEALEIWEALHARLENARSSSNETAWLVGADLVVVYVATGRFEEAYPLAESLIAETTEDLGPWHPRIARLSSELVRLETKRGRRDEAMRHARRAVKINAAAYGPVNRRTAISYLPPLALGAPPRSLSGRPRSVRESSYSVWGGARRLEGARAAGPWRGLRGSRRSEACGSFAVASRQHRARHLGFGPRGTVGHRPSARRGMDRAWPRR